jgi:hypothetical protein
MEGMIADFSLAGLLKYCDELGVSGQRKKSTASAMKTACERLLVDLSPDEKEDVRRIDVDAAATKYSNRKVAKPNTCREYRRRVLAAIAEFIKHMETKEAVQPCVAVNPSPEKDTSADEEIAKPARAKPAHIPREAPSSTAMTLQIPVRSDFMAQLVLPYDLTPAEAERLSKIIEALPMR